MVWSRRLDESATYGRNQWKGGLREEDRCKVQQTTVVFENASDTATRRVAVRDDEQKCRTKEESLSVQEYRRLKLCVRHRIIKNNQ